MVPQLVQVQVTRRTPEARPASATMPAHAAGGDRSAFADQLSAALDRYGFSVCRSASVFEDFEGYAAVIVLLSPGATEVSFAIMASLAIARTIGIGRGRLAPPSLMLTMRRTCRPSASA